MSEFLLQVKDVAVMGLGVSGRSVIGWFHARNIVTRCFDDNPEQERTARELGSLWTKPEQGLLSNASMLVVSPGIARYHKVVREAMAKGIEIVNDIELFARAYPLARVIGITGTNGKSTLTRLLTHLLVGLGERAVAAGNYGVPVLSLDMGGDPLVVLELSSYQLERCLSLSVNVGAITNLTADHLERYHYSFEEYVETKLRLLYQVHAGGIVVLDSSLRKFPQVVWHLGFRKGETLQLIMSEPLASKDGYRIAVGEGENICIDGSFPLSGYAGSKLTSLGLGILAALEPSFFLEISKNKKRLLEILRSYQPLEHRQELVAEKRGVKFVNDSKATNPESTAVALERYENIFWIAGGRDKDTSLLAIEPYLEKLRGVYLVGEASVRIEAFLRGHANRLKIRPCEVLEEATRQAAMDAVLFCRNGAKATVLLSPLCSSFDQFQSFAERGKKFKCYLKAMQDKHP